jgi:hypothetical protein
VGCEEQTRLLSVFILTHVYKRLASAAVEISHHDTVLAAAGFRSHSAFLI